uniref:SJCHGC00376 protein n=1 Tax=Schistosoma japonicum TaxID=6182 RepID=Q5BTK2_SCHJA|nr:SJCHGC00376 protein [Schistosoma japonicum]
MLSGRKSVVCDIFKIFIVIKSSTTRWSLMMNIVFIVTSHIIYYPSTLFCCIFATFENKVNFAAKTLMYNMASCWLCMCESSELRSFALILFGKSHVMGLPLDCNLIKYCFKEAVHCSNFSITSLGKF